MRLRTFAALLAITLLAWPVAAQEQRGSIEGVVKDTSGRVLPGVTVEAKSGGSGVLIDDIERRRQLPVPVGAARHLRNQHDPRRVQAGQGRRRRSEARLDQEVSSSACSSRRVTEAVTVTAESPIVDTKSSGKSTNIRAEQVSLLPHAATSRRSSRRRRASTTRAKSAGVMIDGASAAENRYVIDGIETTDIIGGLSGKNLLADFVEEVQVKSTGYPAEFGGSTGGVINVLTKSGSNSCTAACSIYFQGSSTTGENNQTLRAVLRRRDPCGVPHLSEGRRTPATSRAASSADR